MASEESRYVVWVAPIDASPLSDTELRSRADVFDATVEVRREMLQGWALAAIPATARDEWGDRVPGPMSLGLNVLPPEGRVYVVGSD